jgi:hypothetical protein
MTELVCRDGRMFGLDGVDWLVWLVSVAALGGAIGLWVI